MPCVCAKCGREDAIARGEAGSGDGRERRRKWACSCRVCSASGAEVRQCLLTWSWIPLYHISPSLDHWLSPTDCFLLPSHRLQLLDRDGCAIGGTSPAAVDSSSPRGATQQGEAKAEAAPKAVSAVSPAVDGRSACGSAQQGGAKAEAAGAVSAVSPAMDVSSQCRPGPALAVKQGKPKAKAQKGQRKANVDGALVKAAEIAAAAEQPGRPSDLPRPASERKYDQPPRHSDGEDEPSPREPAADILSPAHKGEDPAYKGEDPAYTGEDPAAALSNSPVEEGGWKVANSKGRKGGDCTAAVLPGRNHLRPHAPQEAALQLQPPSAPTTALGAPPPPAVEPSSSSTMQRRPVPFTAAPLATSEPTAATVQGAPPPPPSMGPSCSSEQRPAPVTAAILAAAKPLPLPLLGSWAEQARRKREEAETRRRKSAEEAEEEATLLGSPLGRQQDAFLPQSASLTSLQPQAQDAGLSSHRASSPPPPPWGDWPAVILEAVESACPGANELDVMPQVRERDECGSLKCEHLGGLAGGHPRGGGVGMPGGK